MKEDKVDDPTSNEKTAVAVPSVEIEKPSVTAEIPPNKVKTIYGNWNKYNPFVSSEFYESTNSNSPQNKDFAITQKLKAWNNQEQFIPKITEIIRFEHSMTCYKETLLPQKRGLYESLYKGNVNKHGAQSIQGSVKADNISLYPGKSDKEKLVDRLVNGLDIDEELSDEYDDDFGSSCDEQM